MGVFKKAAKKVLDTAEDVVLGKEPRDKQAIENAADKIKDGDKK